MAYNSSLSLPDCASITSTTPCAPCFFGGKTSYLTFPYTLTSTVTVTVFPVYTGYPGSSTFVSFETDSITVTLSEDGRPIPTFGADLTWEVNGLTLTSGTTYASFANFSGAAPTRAIPSYNRRDAATRTSTKAVLPYQAYPTRSASAAAGSRLTVSNQTCVGLADVSSITLPATVDPSSFIIPVTTSTSVQFTSGVVPTQIIQYLDGLSTVTEQLGGNKVETCSPTTYPSASPIVCTYVTTISSQTTATSASCTTTTVDGTPTTTCPVYDGQPSYGTPAASSTAVVTSTRAYPTAPASAPGPVPPVSKTSGLSILTETGTNRLRLPTAGGETPSRTQGEPANNSPTNPPYSGPTGESSPDNEQPPPNDSQPGGEQPQHDQPSGDTGGGVSQPNDTPPSNDQPSGNNGPASPPDNSPPTNGQAPGNTGGQGQGHGNVQYGTSPSDQNPQGSANTYIPPPITAQGTTYSPTPIIYTSSGTAVTYYPAAAITTISGAAVTYYPTPYTTTINGVPVTDYPPAATFDAGDSSSARPPSYVPITIPPTEQGCTATVTVTYSPVRAGNVTETSTGVGDYINTGVNSTPAQQTGGAEKESVDTGTIFAVVMSVLAGLCW